MYSYVRSAMFKIFAIRYTKKIIPMPTLFVMRRNGSNGLRVLPPSGEEPLPEQKSNQKDASQDQKRKD